MKVISTTEDDLRVLGEKLAASPRHGFDTETTADEEHEHPKAMMHWHTMEICGYSFGFSDGSKTYVPLIHAVGDNAPTGPAMQLLERALTDKSKTIVAHNSKFELLVLATLRRTHKMVFEWLANMEDSMISIWMLEFGLGGNDGHRLKPLVKKYLNHVMQEWLEVVPKHMRCHEVDPLTVGPYAADDALQALRLEDWCRPSMEKLKLMNAYRELCIPFIHVVRHMEDVGQAIDPGFLLGYQEQLRRESGVLALEWDELVGCPIGSNQKISTRLYDDLKWWPVPMNPRKSGEVLRGKSGFCSVDAGNRKRITEATAKGSPGRKAVEIKNRHSRLAKLISTYTSSMVKHCEHWPDKRVRSNWKQHGTKTGRLASTAPALMNIPIRTPEGSKIREAFIAEEGWVLGVADESQFELRIMAHLSQDEMMMRAYLEDIDLHQQTADSVGVDRGTGKVMNLALIYEASDWTLSKSLDISQARATPIHKTWHATYPRVAKYHARQHALGEKHHYVRTITNRIRRIPENVSELSRGMRGHWNRIASNSPSQGSAADIMNIAMRNLYRDWKARGELFDIHTGKGRAKICMQIHDELVVELRKDFAEEGFEDTCRHLESAVTLRVPLKAEGSLGPNWLAAKG